MASERSKIEVEQGRTSKSASLRQAAEDILAAISPREREDSVPVPVSLDLGPLALEALGGAELSGEQASRRLDLVLRYYLRDVATKRETRPYPETLGATRPGAASTLELSLDNRLWTAFEDESRRQGVPAADLAAHAIFYFAADAESGVITERILADLDPEGDFGAD
jgi:hypothetical protein